MEILNYQLKIETEKAILIKALVEELNQVAEFWLPKNKIDIQDKKIIVEDVFWKDKVEQIANPAPIKMVEITSKYAEKNDRSSKVIVEVIFNKINKFDMYVFVPNTALKSILKDKEHEQKYFVQCYKWAWEGAYRNALEYQLNFYNRDEPNKYSLNDFVLVSEVKVIE